MTSNCKLRACGTKNNPNWADLPRELLEAIAEHLHSPINVFRYRAVCTSWRSAFSLSSRLTTVDNDVSTVTICRLENRHDNSSFLVKVVEKPIGQFHVLSPLTIPKPDFIFRKNINLLDYRLSELCKGYHFSSNSGKFHFQKAVNFRECGILAIYDYGKLGFRVFKDENWTLLGENYNRYDDILLYQDDYYVIDKLGIIYLIDKFMNLVVYLPQLHSKGQLKNLVESDGNLYVVDTFFSERIEQGEVNGRVRFKKVDMNVYKLDENWGIWVQIKSLEDRIFVLGKEVCFSVSSTDFTGCQGNCIYFIAHEHLEEGLPMSFVGFDALEELPGDDFDHQCCCEGGVFRPPSRSVTGVVNSSSLYNEGMGYYAICVFNLEDRSIRDIEGSTSFKRLFSPSNSCFL